MKKIKLFILSAAIVAAGSAFISKPQAPEYVKDNGAWVLKSSVDGITGECQSLEKTHCSFILKDESTQPPYQDNDFTPDDQDRVWHHFQTR